jgi:hypothetical protein
MEFMPDKTDDSLSRFESPGPRIVSLNYFLRLLRAALITLPAFKQPVQTRIVFTVPFTLALTVRRLGFQRRDVTLWAWETLRPKTGFFPHISHTLAILSSPKNL